MADNLYRDLEKLKIDDTEGKPPVNVRKWITLIFVTGIVISTILFLSRKSPPPHKPVSFFTVTTHAYGESLTLMTAGGYIVAESEITVSSKVAGSIATLSVREGDLIDKGEIIAILDNDELRTQREEAEANLKKDALNLKYRQELYEKDRTGLMRQRELFKENLISPSRLDKEEKNLVIAKLELDRAKSELEVCKKRLQLTKIRFEESTIRAPITGTVIDKIADVGEMLFPMKTTGGKSGSAIVTLADLRVMNVEIDINEDDIEKVTLKSPVLITPDSFPDRSYQGEVTAISPMADRQKNVVPIKVRIKDPDSYLKPDMSAKVTFQGSIPDAPQEKAAITIPLHAVVSNNGKNTVLVTEGSHTVEREVQLGTVQGGYVVVEKGLKDGEHIALESHPHSKD